MRAADVCLRRTSSSKVPSRGGIHKDIYANWAPQERIMMSNLLSSELSKLVANTMLAPRVSSLNSISQRRKKTGAACRKFPRHRSRFEDILNLDYICKCKGMHEVAKY